MNENVCIINRFFESVERLKSEKVIRGLKTICDRHSWATIAASLDIPEDTISQALGHSSRNATTAIYIQRELKKVDEANRRVIDWVLYGQK